VSDELKRLMPTVKSIHFIGIGGVSMSAIAQIMKARGYTVTGSDIRESESISRLRAAGINISIGHAPENINGSQLIVYTAAVKPDNPELCAAKSSGIPCFERAPFLGEILTAYSCPIGVAGTHGKTTTSSMLSEILKAAGLEPTVLIGGIVPSMKSNYYIGGSEYVVFESCEYSDSFLHFPTKISIILNVEAEHLDYFKSRERLLDSFRRYANRSGKDGTVIVCGDSKGAMKATEDVLPRRITYGLDGDWDFTAKNIVYNNGYPSFTVYYNNEPLFETGLSVPGRHNILNALAATAASRLLDVSPNVIAGSLSKFTGTKRRFERLGVSKKGFTVVDDYAHHPTEVAATLSAAANFGYKKIWCIFQPHTYTRTKYFFSDFVKALGLADHVVLTDIYSAREKDPGDISSSMLANSIKNAVYLPDFNEAANYVASRAQPEDLVITMGAGNVNEIGRLLLSL
jgi:UDP-N-acetylmuramate--alanine ligase